MGHEGLIAGLGAVVGVVLGLTGAGGGALAVPLLVLAAGMPIQSAASMSLVAVGLAALLGAGLGLREGIVRYRAASLIGVAGVAAAPVGVWAAGLAPQRPLLAAFALFMLFVAWRSVRPPKTVAAGGPGLPCFRPEGERQLRWTWRCAAVLGRTGAFSGLLSGMLGVGGGLVIVPALERHSNLDSASIRATSLAVIALVAVSASIAAGWHGRLQASLAWPFAVGSIAGLLAGRSLSARVAERFLRRAFALVCVLVAALVSPRAATGFPG